MIANFLKSRRSAAAERPSLPAGKRAYAIGDIHGCDSLLTELLAAINDDDRSRPAAETVLIFLGDLIDRGPSSAAVVERLRRLAEDRPNTRFLMGNHEELLLSALGGDRQALRLFARVGGRETLLSYGVTSAEFDRFDFDELHKALVRIIPPAHRDFLARFEDQVTIGDFLFVHAGIRPGVALEEQRSADLRWIRAPFLDHGKSLGKMVVHGHTISDEPEVLPHRIGIDTGAYATGRLTALGLEGDATWHLST